MLGSQQLVDINQMYNASDAEVDVLLDERVTSDIEEMQDLFEMAQQPLIDAFAFAFDRYSFEGPMQMGDVSQCPGLHNRCKIPAKGEACIEEHTVSIADVQKTLHSVVVKHKARLVRLNATTKKITQFVCHQWGNARRKGQEHQRLCTSKKCGCSFMVSLIFSRDGMEKATIRVLRGHQGHVPGSLEDLYHLPVHPMVKKRCMEDLFDIGTCRHVARSSVSKEAFHINMASSEEQVTYRFFMIPKEIQMLAYNLRIKGRLGSDDWSSMYKEALKLKEQQKVLHCQPYNPDAPEERDRPFILVIQDEWMLRMCMRFSSNNAWAINSTFKTNVFGMPLYAALVPNQHGVGLPLWFMLCTHDVGTSQESVALHITLQLVFQRMKNIRPKALVIDKCMTSLKAIKQVVDADPFRWAVREDGTHKQVACIVLVCWFHTKKAWVEHLLPQVFDQLLKSKLEVD
ncbi:hypothetical protein L7F22_007562 [Adiantum nelumboides]|nr:hypothetical protein [Adiantum nelumboides]